jgi:uncharacterized membrane protein
MSDSFILRMALAEQEQRERGEKSKKDFKKNKKIIEENLKEIFGYSNPNKEE